MKKIVHFLSDPVLTMWSIIQYNVKVDHVDFYVIQYQVWYNN